MVGSLGAHDFLIRSSALHFLKPRSETKVTGQGIIMSQSGVVDNAATRLGLFVAHRGGRLVNPDLQPWPSDPNH